MDANGKEQKWKGRVLDSSDRMAWMLYFNFIQKDIRAHRFPSEYDGIKWYGMKIKDLQEMAKEHKIPIHKLSEDGKRVKNKTKDELKREIKTKLRIE